MTAKNLATGSSAGIPILDNTIIPRNADEARIISGYRRRKNNESERARRKLDAIIGPRTPKPQASTWGMNDNERVAYARALARQPWPWSPEEIQERLTPPAQKEMTRWPAQDTSPPTS